MAEPTVKIDIVTTAQTAGAESVEASIDKVTDAVEASGEAMEKSAAKVVKAAKETSKASEASAEALNEGVKSADDSLEALFAKTRETVEGVHKKLRETTKEAADLGDKAGDSFKNAAETKAGGIVWTQDTGNAVGKAWEIGTIIGTELSKAITYYMEHDSLDGFLDRWIEGLASKVGVLTDTWEVNLKELADVTQQSLTQSKQEYEAWVNKMNQAPAEDSITWLQNLKKEADDTAAVLKDLQALQKAVQRAQMDTIAQDEADQLDKVDASKAPESEKIKERQKIKNEATQKRLDVRNVERKQQASQSWDDTLDKKDDWVNKQRIEEAQAARAKQWSEMRDQARANSKDRRGNVDEKTAEQQFDLLAKQRGIKDMSYGDSEQKKYEDAKKAREAAEAALQEAERRHNALRKRLDIEEESDRINTGRSIIRDSGKAERQSDAQAQAESDKIAKEAERQRAAELRAQQAEERKQAAEDAKRQAALNRVDKEAGGADVTDAAKQLDDLAGMVKDDPTKEKIAALRASLTDRDGATSSDLQAIREFADKVVTGSLQAQQKIAALLKSVGDALSHLDGDLTSLKVQVDAVKNNQRTF